MKKIQKHTGISAAFITILIFFAATGSSVTRVRNHTWKLVWSDEFDVDGFPNAAKWKYNTGGHGWGNNELEFYTANRAENAKVENGHLVITARKEGYKGKNYTSARIKSEGLASWKYGKVEARIKLPYGQGIWPAFWMLGENFPAVGWPACGEIDIMEMVGGGTGKDNQAHCAAHWDFGGHKSSGGDTTLTSGIFADAFHTFAIEWDPSYIKWFADSKLFYKLDISPASMNAFHKKFFIILNLAVGGNWPGNPDSSTVFPQSMILDYVRVYKDNAQKE